MLTTIQIDNFAIIDHLEVDFKAGMTVLTGETGAGKSIIIDALSLVLGSRTDASVVRNGSKRADITAIFNIDNLPNVEEWLSEQELDEEGDCFLRRVINKEGRSKGFINGHSATLAMMKSLGEQLVDIHGQHAHQALLRAGMQSKMLNNFANLGKFQTNVRNQWHFWKKLEDELAQLQQSEKERHDRLELIEYQVSELDNFGISADEILNIDDEFNRLANINQLIEETQEQLHLLYQNDQNSAFELVSQAASKIEELSELDKALTPAGEMLHAASIQIQEATEELRHYQDKVEQDPEKLHQLDQRLSLLHELARKHRTDVKVLPELHIRLHEELQKLKNSTERHGNLEEDVANAKNVYLKAAKTLSKHHHKAALTLNKSITDYLAKLGMSGGQFAVDFEALPDERYNSEGIEKISFLVTANPGQPLQPLSKVASGGELSRISLAIQVVTVTDSSIPCLIFDEVDVGIGGGTAEVVGNLLNNIASKAQVLCVTHQAQVASKGNQHYRVVKSSEDETTSTFIEDLKTEQRSEEIARMIGGIEITEQTRKHAKEMLQKVS
ncbi:MAG: DNA repair protein RecN [Gammaproteobacteria bacterium]|nr:DNA repair protein RecN [Gammaproteobacteria bacterium]